MSPKFKPVFFILLFLHLITCLVILFDVPVARQVVGFTYFTFITGFIVINLLRIELSNRLEIVLFSIGLSMAFLMVMGLLINELGLLLGLARPLSLVPLMIGLNAPVFACEALVYFRKGNLNFSGGRFNKKLLYISALFILPVMSIVGAIQVGINGNNFILLCMIITISFLFILGTALQKYLHPTFYPLCIFVIAIALLYHATFISNHLIMFGSDICGEYFTFKTTETGARWTSENPYLGGSWKSFGRLNSMLSITILPTIYSTLLGMDPVWMFKMLFPLIFAFVPLGLFHVWQKNFGSRGAFISTFLFMALSTFYTEMLGLNRQMIGELFFVLLLLTISKKEMNRTNKILCFAIFSFALITSHYALAVIFLFLISFAFVFLLVLKRPSRTITTTMVVLFFVAMFLWYIYTSKSTIFNAFLEIGDNIYQQLGDFFNPRAREETVLKGLGLEPPPTIWNMISRMFAYLTEALIAIGFIALILKRTKIHLELETLLLTSLSMAFLAALILVPGLANTLNMTRFYHILLFFLAPLCLLGVETVVNITPKMNAKVWSSILIILVLVPYFLFQTNFVYEVVKVDSWSISLSKYRMDPIRLRGMFGYFDSYRVSGAKWISNNVVVEFTRIYSDFYGKEELRAYGLVYLGFIERISNVTKVSSNGVIYLSSLNIIDGKVVGSRVWNSSELNFLNDMNKVYSNGGSEICKNTP
ncbi:MAG: DUF2206 domain-containing protein [Candidatus Bathyarchaeia archaeon]